MGRLSGSRHGRNDHESLRQGELVGERQVDLRRHSDRGDLFQPRQGAAGQRDRRLAAPEVDHAHVAPEDAAAKAGAERLRAGLFGSEALGVARRASGATLRALLLGRGENALDEPVAEPGERLLDAPDVDQVVADADDHAAAPPARASFMIRRISRIAASRPTKIASPTRKWPMLSSRTSGIEATGATSA